MKQKLSFALHGLAGLAVVIVPAAGMINLRGRMPDAVWVMLTCATMLGLYIASARWIERRKTTELRFDRSSWGLGAGIVLGVALFAAVMGILLLLGAYRSTGLANWRPLGMAFLLAFPGALLEEILFRGFLFRVLATLGGDWTALAATSALFGWAHMANPGTTFLSAAAIAVEAGILLGAAYAASRSLWLPIGIHAGWNFAEGPLFGMAVSGHTRPTGAIGGELKGPEFLTGGAFGPEASVVAVIVCLMLAFVYLRRIYATSTNLAPSAPQVGHFSGGTPNSM